MERRDSAETKRILIVLMGSIGDVVRALPLLGRLRRAWPNAWIAWAVEPKSAPILERHPWLDEVMLYDRGRPLRAFPSFLWRVRNRRFDLVLDLQRHLKSGLVASISGASERLGFARANTKEWNHVFSTRRIGAQPNMKLKLMQYQGFGDEMGLPEALIEFGLQSTAAERSRATELLSSAPRPLLGVILGSSWPSRLYFPDSIAAVVRNLAVRNGDAPLFPVLLGGPEEARIAAQVERSAPDLKMLNLAGKTGLRELFAIFSECEVAFGPDSGPMHIAAAAGCPVVSLWGSTSPLRSAPWGSETFAISGEIPCHPCYLRECPIGRECMKRIEPETVVAMIRKARSMRNAGERYLSANA